MATSTFTLTIGSAASVTYTIGATNAAATDVTAASALMDQIDLVIDNWRAASASDGASFQKQGGSAGAVTAGQSLGTLLTRLKAAQNNLLPLIRG